MARGAHTDLMKTWPPLPQKKLREIRYYHTPVPTQFLLGERAGVRGSSGEDVLSATVLDPQNMVFSTFSRSQAQARLVRALLVWIFGLILVTGCGGPAYLGQPDFDGEAIGRALLEDYDADGDGLLSEAELEKCPSVLEGIKRFDSGGDRQVSPEEIAARVGVWSKGRVAVMRFEPRVLLNGKPLANALVEFVPERAMAEIIKPASGVTSRSGYVEIVIAAEDLPPDTPYVGMHMGLYKVKITHPKRKIPARYNTETELGQEVTRDLGYGVSINLKSS